MTQPLPTSFVIPGSLSIEVMHVHPWKLEFPTALQAARVAARNIANLTADRSRRGQPTSCVVMLDDYFLSGKPSRIERILSSTTEVLLEAAADSGIRLDLVVRESAMASIAPQAVDLVADSIVDGVLFAKAPYRRFAVDEVPLYSDQEKSLWSCPFLAAVWQLVRLGLVEFDSSHIQVVGRDVPVAAERTLTLLSTKYLATEAAVQAVCASLPEPLANEVSARASHLFVPDIDESPTTGSAIVQWPQGSEKERVVQWLDTVGSRPAAVLGDIGPVGVIEAAGLSRPYAVWETVISGPETLTVARRVAARRDDVAEGLSALTSQVPREGFAGLLYFAAEDELDVATTAGFVPVLASPSWGLLLWVAPDSNDPFSWAHRTGGQATASWLVPENPPTTQTTNFQLTSPGLELVDAISHLDSTQYLAPLSAGDVAQLVSTWPAVVALVDGVVVGAALTRAVPGSNSRVGELYTVVVDPHYRGQGIGSAMLTAVETGGWLYGWEGMYLESSQAYNRHWSGSPVPLYLRNGWKIAGETPRTVYMAKPRPNTKVL